MEESNDDITIERVIAEAELIRNREEKVSLTDRLRIAKETFTKISNDRTIASLDEK